jgi:CRISPR-associated protein Csc3
MCLWKGERVFVVDFLKKSVAADDQVMHSFIESMLPQLIINYAACPAKGGEHTGRDTQTKENFEALRDQSMLTHQLNGVFPALHLVRILEIEKLGTLGQERLTDLERELYILSYAMHDVDKIRDLHGLKTTRRADIEDAKQIIMEELRKCKVEDFCPDFIDYLEDITFLVVNTQRKWGTHLTTFGWQLRLREDRLSLLRELCTYSDLVAYGLSSPSTIDSGQDAAPHLKTILSHLSDDQLVFSYHHVREVRGLLTNVINGAIGHLVAPDEQPGIWAYLFFSDGIIYIQRKTRVFTLSMESIIERVQERLREICAGVIKSQAPGFKFSIQGIARYPGYYFEFLQLEEFATLLARFTVNRTRNDITALPLAKLRQMQATGEIAADLPVDFKSDYRAGMVSRFLSVVFATLLGKLDKKQQAQYKRVEQAVIEVLGLKPYWEQAKTIPNKGGVEYRWFWLGALYMQNHPGCDDEDLRKVFDATLKLMIEMVGDELRKQMPQQYLGHLARYLATTVELSASLGTPGNLPDFYAEMERYSGAKDKGRKLICTLCNSAYPTEEQADSSVLFQPWVYKNKLSLYSGKNAGGICVICSLELMLRQILLKGQLRLTGSKFDALKTKYIAVYPNYFFTAETGAMVQGILKQLSYINFFDVRRQLQGKSITVEELLELEAFQAPTEILYPHADEDDLEEKDDSDTDEDEPTAVQTGASERSYIKYEYPKDSYPGMYFFGMKAGKSDDDTSSWAMPAFLALALPLVMGAKVVISEMLLPLISSGNEFHETVLFDAPHSYLDTLLRKKAIRINEVLPKLSLLTSIYRVNLDTYAKQGKPEWKHLSAIARDLATDELYLFSYLRKQQRSEKRDSFYPDTVTQYLDIYKKMVLEGKLGKIQECVDYYVKFYRGGYESHSILRPVDIVAKAIINSPPEIEEDDLLWQIKGEMKNWLDRVHNGQAKGWAVFKRKEIDTKQAEAVSDFVEYFYKEVFCKYCQGERSILNSRLNRFKDGCEAYYTDLRTNRRIQEQTTEPEVETVL